MPTFGSLFAGIGGIDLGLERAGWECRFQVEWDPYCQHVLAHHWPDVPRYGDITAVDWSTVGRVDLLAGGFPCQPVSYAGRGLAQEDARWLWPEFRRAIGELRPRYVLVENVPGLLARGMGDVLGDLATLGFDAEWDCVPAAALGAPHIRDRVWIVAHDDRGHRRASGSGEAEAGAAGYALDGSGAHPNGRTMADAQSRGRDGASAPEPREHQGERSVTVGGRGVAPQMADAERLGPSRSREPVRPFHPAAYRDGQAGEPRDGGWWSVEPDVGRVAHGVPARVDRLRALGNAVVPQVVEVIGRRLIEMIEAAA